MAVVVDTSKFAASQLGSYRVWARDGVDPAALTRAIQAKGATLKESRKAYTRRVDSWVIKESGRGASRMLKLAFAGHARRQAFEAAVFLEQHGIAAPKAIGYVEQLRGGAAVRNWTVTEYLESCVDVETFADRLLKDGADGTAIKQYLLRIAAAVNRLTSAGAYHRDLAGKNILTRDGETFYFIDLDSVSLGAAYTYPERLKNHVQLYDSFCDRIKDFYLEPFIAAMNPPTENIAMYMGAVKKTQKARRERTEAVWRKEGKPVRKPPT